MNKVMKYSVLRYSPRLNVGEAINLGILVSDEENRLADFYYSTKRSRVEAFDDEIGYARVLKLLKSIKKDIEEFDKKKQEFDMNQYIKYYINAFYFEKPTTINYDSYEETALRLKKLFLWFDFEKKDRFTKEDSVKAFKEMIQRDGMKVYHRKSDIGEYEDEIHYDLQTEKYNIVLFDLNERNLSKQVNSAKLWSWNSSHHKSDREILFVLNDNGMEQEDYRVVKRVLNDSLARVVPFSEAIRLIQEA